MLTLVFSPIKKKKKEKKWNSNNLQLIYCDKLLEMRTEQLTDKKCEQTALNTSNIAEIYSITSKTTHVRVILK